MSLQRTILLAGLLVLAVSLTACSDSTEPSAGSDAASLVTEAFRDGRDYIINGYKTFISNAGIADVYVIFATVDISQGHRGITAFIVDKDTPGLVIAQE